MLRAKMEETTARLRGREELRHFIRMVRIRLRGQMDSANPQFWMNATNLARQNPYLRPFPSRERSPSETRDCTLGYST